MHMGSKSGYHTRYNSMNMLLSSSPHIHVRRPHIINRYRTSKNSIEYDQDEDGDVYDDRIAVSPTKPKELHQRLSKALQQNLLF